MSDASKQLYNDAVDSLQAAKVPEALEKVEKALTEDPKDGPCWHLYALILSALQRPEDAAKASAKAQEFGGNDVDAILLQAASAAVDGRIPQAISLYEDALEVDDTRFEIWVNYAMVLIQEGYNDDALDASGKAVTLEPGNAQSWYTRGRILRLCEKIDDAMEAFDKSLALDPRLAICWHERGMVFSVQEKHQDALTCFEKVLELQPGDSGAAQAIEITRMNLEQQQ